MFWLGGAMRGNGTTTIAEGGTLFVRRGGPRAMNEANQDYQEGDWEPKYLDRVLNNFGRVGWTGIGYVERQETGERFKNPSNVPSAFEAARQAWAAYISDLQAARVAFESYEAGANTDYENDETALAQVYETGASGLAGVRQAEATYQNDLDQAQNRRNQAAPDDIQAEEAYWNEVAQAEATFDDTVDSIANTYLTAESQVFAQYQTQLANARDEYVDQAVSALGRFRSAVQQAGTVQGIGDAFAKAEYLYAIIHGLLPPPPPNQLYSPPTVESVLQGTTAEARASIAVAYRRLYGVELAAELNDSQRNYLYYGQYQDPEAPINLNETSFFNGLLGWVNSTFDSIGQLAVGAWNGVTGFAADVWNTGAQFVQDVAYLLRNDPAALGSALREGLSDGAAIAANGLTAGTIPALDEHVQELVEENGGLYRTAYISAAIGREALTTAVSAGVTQIAAGGSRAAARWAATRMGVSQASQTRVACALTTGARLYQPVATYQQLTGAITAAEGAAEAINHGDLDRAAMLLSRAGFNSIGLYGSLRETTRFARALGSLNGQRVRDYLQACFAAGTPILSEAGPKPIEELRTGERVWARDESDPSGPLQLKEIEAVFTNVAPIWHLHLGGQVIRTTPEHPFYVLHKGWTEAKELQIGDLLLGRDNEFVPLEDILDTGVWETVYNMRVAEHHTYFVGDEAWGFAIWAHNSCAPGVVMRRDMAVDNTFRNRNGTIIPVYGSPQNTTGSPNNPHAAAIMAEVARMVRNAPAGSYVVLNRSWRTALGREFTSTSLRPDIIMVRPRPNGQYAVDAREIASPTDDPDALGQRMSTGWGTVQSQGRLVRGSFRVR